MSPKDMLIFIHDGGQEGGKTKKLRRLSGDIRVVRVSRVERVWRNTPVGTFKKTREPLGTCEAYAAVSSRDPAGTTARSDARSAEARDT